MLTSKLTEKMQRDNEPLTDLQGVMAVWVDYNLDRCQVSMRLKNMHSYKHEDACVYACRHNY